MGARWALRPLLPFTCAITLVAACSTKPEQIDSSLIDAAGLDPLGDGGDFTNPGLVTPIDAGITYYDAEVSADAFFINDPPVPTCDESGKMSPPPDVVGTLECPGDKNREGCECKTPGEVASCWPGQRLNRNHGVCRDGKTTCQEGFEFGNRWGPCEGYALPVDGASQGAPACRCFSNGTWALANLVPCIFQDVDQKYYVYSSRPDGAQGYACDPALSVPPTAPAAGWTPSTLTVDCGGRFKLCYTIKAGRVDAPQADDCVLTQACVETWYPTAGAVQELPELPGWAATDTRCTARFVEQGGYGEMSVRGKSLECDVVDDGKGQPFVFQRASHCPPRCGDSPEDAECKSCAAGGSGEF